jgi:glutamate synthase domain-containing protein 3
MARQCHLNTCPVGIATQDERLRTRFAGNPEMVISYFRAIVAEVREYLASMGVRSLTEITGAVERLKPRDLRAEDLLRGLLESLSGVPEQLAKNNEQESGLHTQLLKALQVAHVNAGRFWIANSDRSIGANLSGELCRQHNGNGAAREIVCDFHGNAGQSFGAFLVPGVSFRLVGEANDYVGKGLSGGRIAITAGPAASRRGDVLAGNTVLYGATAGELYIAGRAGERFAVRNSGALAVVEGVGQHGCEYMTAGVVLILGPVGVNLGSGMTGGLVYGLPNTLRRDRYNEEFVTAVTPEPDEEQWLRRVLRQHFELTASPLAAALLHNSAPLPLLRLQPLHPPCGVAETWECLLSRFEGERQQPTPTYTQLPPPQHLPEIRSAAGLLGAHAQDFPDPEFVDSGWV